jgi:biopolymer transport protein ExbD
MARREVGEINAGSMADIAFLLLIFFLVTTTMEVDAGISRQLPIKLDNPPDIEIDINMRNVLEIQANSQDKLLVEREFIEIEDLEQIVLDFYTINIENKDVDKNMPNYGTVTLADCDKNIVEFTKLLEEEPDNKLYESELNKWKIKKELCEASPGKSYKEINKQAVIQLKNQSGTSYGLYIEIHNTIQRIVNKLRVAKCEEMGWGNYFELKPDLNEDDAIIMDRLKILVPERIIESKIQS